MERLNRGCIRLGIPAPDPGRLFAEAMAEIAQQDRCVLKIIITRGPGGRGYRPPVQARPNRVLHSSPWPDYPETLRETGVTIRVCATPLGSNPALAQIKHLNRLEQVMARSEWEDPAVAEGLMLDPAGRVVEGTMTNLFVVTEGRLSTPDLSRCGTAGVMRSLIMEIGSSLGMPVEERDIPLAELWSADALFLSNSLIGIWPVKEVDGREFRPDAVPSPLIDAVMARGFSA